MIDKFLLVFFRLFRKRLSPFDFKLSETGYIGLQAAKLPTRVGIFELLEIYRIAHKDKSMRKNAAELQKEFLRYTKNPSINNLLPHERVGKPKKEITSDLLPRNDLFF